MVVFTDEDHGQVPEPCHVEGLKNLALIGSTISIPAHSQHALKLQHVKGTIAGLSGPVYVLWQVECM